MLLLWYHYVIVHAVFTRIMLWQRCIQRSCVTLIPCLYVYSWYASVMVHSINHAYLRKHCHLTAILSRRRIFSNELLLCEIPAIIWDSKFMTSKEAYHSSFQPLQHYWNIFKQHFTRFIYIFNRINESISRTLLQEHMHRNEEVSGKNIYSSKMFYASFMLTPLFI